MNKLIGMIVSLVLYVCFGTLVAQCAAVAYLWQSGYLSEGKLTEIDAVMRDFTPADVKAALKVKASAPVPSASEVARARALAQRDIELREQALRHRADQIKLDQVKLLDDVARYNQTKRGFDNELALLQDKTTSISAENARVVLENLKPKQAKDQLIRIIDNGEMDDAVQLLSAMSVGKRAKLCTEFKTPDEAKKLADILKRIREGDPEMKVIDAAKNKLKAGV